MHPTSQVSDLFHKSMQEIIKFPYLRQLIEVITQGPAILRGVSSVQMVMAVEVLVSLGWIPTHPIRPFEK